MFTEDLNHHPICPYNDTSAYCRGYYAALEFETNDLKMKKEPLLATVAILVTSSQHAFGFADFTNCNQPHIPHVTM
jgi:hypothetical protein